MAVDDAYTVSLLHFDGADESTAFTDESGKSWTRSGGAKIDTAQSKFGGASGYFDGNGDWITTATHTDFNFGTGNFTVDCWAYPVTGGTDYPTILASGKTTWAAGCVGFSFVTASNTYSFGGNGMTGVASGVITKDTWSHLAVVRSGTALKIYVNGTQSGSATDGGAYDFSNTSTMIGRTGWATDAYWYGWIDELRVSKGIARWTADFTPPAYPYPIPSASKTTWFFMQQTKRLWDNIGGFYVPRQQGLVTI